MGMVVGRLRLPLRAGRKHVVVPGLFPCAVSCQTLLEPRGQFGPLRKASGVSPEAPALSAG